MKLEIWADIMCPFCYMGKRRLETALRTFTQKKKVDLVWRSYQLDPDLRASPGTTIQDYLAQRKGITADWSQRMHTQIQEEAAELGLALNFDKVVVANSFDAHRLAHFARKSGLQDRMQERLFSAYFTEGRNLGDHRTLLALGEEVGLPKTQTSAMLSGGLFAREVQRECREAEQLGATGVPFFVVDRRYGFMGAQPPEQILEVLTEALTTDPVA